MTRPRFTENKSYLEGPQTRPNPVNRPINVHLFVLLQSTVPLPIPAFVWCQLLRMFQYADSSRPAVVTLLRGLYLWNRKPD